MTSSIRIAGRPARVRAWAPGRIEIAGNHVDHQNGRVIAAAIECGIHMEVEPRDDGLARVESEGFAPVEISLDDLRPREDECGTTAALVRGVASGLHDVGASVRGFSARVRSDVPAGGGLSSSAAFELALCNALSVLFGGRAIDSVTASRICQQSERRWFGKPCGLMDQLAVSCGGINLFDFAEGDVKVEAIDFDFDRAGIALVVVDTHCDHSRYTTAYSQVAKDMEDAARFLGARSLRDVDRARLLIELEGMRAKLGDLVALRALHYVNEMHLVDARANALRDGDVERFLAATCRSAASSAQYLQNVSTFERSSQPAMMALALADLLLDGRGAVRIHGGGFGGTVLAFVPHQDVDRFCLEMDAQLGSGSCVRHRVSAQGSRAWPVSD